MKILVDENIAYGKEAFAGFGEVSLISGRNFSAEKVKDYDILAIRSISKMNKNILEGSRVKFIGTATIGLDHIDTNYLAEAGIKYANAAGCNSFAVAEYVFSAITHLAKQNEFHLKNKTLGIVGLGNIGSKVAKMGKAAGLKILKNDPPLERRTGDKSFCSINEILEADIITLHVPLNLEGKDKTFHLIDKKELSKIKPGSIIINSSRGPVVNNLELKKELLSGKKINAVLDVWENEPFPDLELLNAVSIATPHIAGYSFEGKVNGTVQIYHELCRFLNIEPKWKPDLPLVMDNEIILNDGSVEDVLFDVFQKVYPIKNDDSALRKILDIEANSENSYFDTLRKNYPLRRELSNFRFRLENEKNDLIPVLKTFRLQLET